MRTKLLSLNKGYFIVLLISFAFCESRGQNLIKNDGFENYITPPNWNTTGGGFFDYSFFPEHRIVLDWDVLNSPDYFNVICPGTYRGIPTNTFGNAYPKQGNAYAGIEVYYDNASIETKEYIYQNLSSPLKQDSIYCLSFFISYSDRTTVAIKNIGAYFSTNAPSLVSNSYVNATPQIINSLGFLTDTLDWMEVQGCFVAQGGEQYITIGNFNTNVNTDTLFTKTLNPFSTGTTKFSYYYIDSVTLWQNNFPTAIKENNKSEIVSVCPNPANSAINVKITGTNAGRKYSIKIVDVLGKEVLNENYKEQIDISSLERGIYFLSVYEDERLIGTKKLIKN